MIDLHMHSLFSDGTNTPEELAELAARESLTAVALTDHDTIAGVPAFIAAAEARGLRTLSGVEVSTSHSPGEMHLLGYGFDHTDAMLAEQLMRIRSAREARNEEIFEKLGQLGVPVSWDEIKVHAGDDAVIGRPHFAQALITRGYVPDHRAAFSKYLASGRPAYARRHTLPPEDAIAILRNAGGLPVLAHPFTLDLKHQALRALIGELREMGLGGIEVYYTHHTEKQRRDYLALAKEFDLVATGGTDYHGTRTPDLTVGRGFGSLSVPDDIVDQIWARIRN